MNDIVRPTGLAPQPTWKDQYERMKRAHRRFQLLESRIARQETKHLQEHGAAASSCVSKRTLQALDDALWHFILDCYHLKDWLINDESLNPRITEKELLALIKNSEDLSLVRKLANGHKHLLLLRGDQPDPKPLTKVGPVQHGFSVVYDRQTRTQVDSAAFLIRLIDLGEGRRRSVKSLFRNALDVWQRFLTTRKLL